MAGQLLGFLSALVAVLLFGSNFVVVKEYDMADGVHFNFIMSVGIWFCGLVTVIIRCLVNQTSTYFFHPLAILSGVIWSTGNILTVPIIQTIGLALGMSIWCCTQLVVGWSTGKWGLLGTPKDTSIQHPSLNYIGVAIVFVSLAFFLKVRPNHAPKDDDNDHRTYPHIPNSEYEHGPISPASVQQQQQDSKSLPFLNSDSSYSIRRLHQKQLVQQSWVDQLTLRQRYMIGVVASIIAGFCYGVMFCPIQSIIDAHRDNDESGKYSPDMLDYVFVVYNGIFCTSLLYYLIYTAYKKNNPFINNRSVLPSIVCGIVWAIAMNAYFMALDPKNLGVDTTFPIMSAGPQVISSLWGVLYYKEIKGKRNISYLVIAVMCSLVAVVLVSLSKFDI